MEAGGFETEGLEVTGFGGFGFGALGGCDLPGLRMAGSEIVKGPDSKDFWTFCFAERPGSDKARGGESGTSDSISGNAEILATVAGVISKGGSVVTGVRTRAGVLLDVDVDGSGSSGSTSV
jgi:hypothetical protein